MNLFSTSTAALLAAALCMHFVPVAYAVEHDSDLHAHHHMASTDMPGPLITVATYAVPTIKLTRADGVEVDLRTELDDGRPVILNFIFTTCTAVCPITSQIFSELQKSLGPKPAAHLVSISIDPEEDTVPKLAKYASRYAAGPRWTFYTGSLTASVVTQKAFKTFRGDKMNHVPVTLIRGRPGQDWKRVDGLATSAELLAVYQNVITAK